MLAYNQQQLCSPTDTSPKNAPDICAVRTCEMVLPKYFHLWSMNTSSPISMQIEDSASADVPDDMQLVTHASGSHGSFTKYERLTEIRLLLADADFTPKPADIILSKMGCIYQFLHTNVNKGKLIFKLLLVMLKRFMTIQNLSISDFVHVKVQNLRKEIGPMNYTKIFKQT